MEKQPKFSIGQGVIFRGVARNMSGTVINIQKPIEYAPGKWTQAMYQLIWEGSSNRSVWISEDRLEAK